jgi:hypothetical protein
LRAFVLGEKVLQFVAKDGGTTGFEDDDRRRRFDYGEQLVHNLEEQSFGAVEHANVVERSSTAEASPRNGDVETGCFEDFDGGFGGRGEKVVIKRVGP